MTTKHSDRLQSLVGFAQSDPMNVQLVTDAASTAIAEDDPALASDLLDRYESRSPLPATLVNLKGVAALARGNWSEAAAIFEDLRRQDSGDPALRFNLAWAQAMQGAYREALELLDDDTVAVSPRAPALKIHALHHLALYDDALASGEHLAKRFPDNEELMGALATLALDAERSDLAFHYAHRAHSNAEGRAALGILALGDHKTAQSLQLFDQAIAASPANPRAWIGKGLGLLASGQAAAGAEAIDKGAAFFDTHIGSWIASGWAHFVAGDAVKARESFERAMAIDENFSECHGGLAVLDFAAGELESAKRRSDVALRLDKSCFGGALAKSLLLDRSGHAAAAQKIRDAAFTTPIGPNGRTLAQELVGFGFRAVPVKNGGDPKRRG